MVDPREAKQHEHGEQKERSYPESNRGRPDVLHHQMMSIRTGSDNRYTIKPSEE